MSRLITYESPISSFIQYQLISTPTQLNLNSISTKLPLNLISTSFQLQVQIYLSLNSTSTITSTQYGCDTKATQSCSTIFFSFLKPSLMIMIFQSVYHVKKLLSRDRGEGRRGRRTSRKKLIEMILTKPQIYLLI